MLFGSVKPNTDTVVTNASVKQKKIHFCYEMPIVKFNCLEPNSPHNLSKPLKLVHSAILLAIS